MNSICIIPARGGSKRIPRKNIREFLGRPIIAYSIEAALKSALFDEVMVSTDDTEIADIARRFGASAPFMRSSEASGDYATTFDVMREVIEEYSLRGRMFDTVCCLYPAAPFVRPSELVAASQMIADGAKSVIPVTSFDFPPLRGFEVGEDGRLSYVFPENASVRSQDLPEMVHDCGRFYFATKDALLESGGFMTADTRPLRISAKLVQDIDSVEDWELAELKYRTMMGGSGE